MSFDGFFIHHLLNEIKNEIIQFRLDKIMTPGPSHFVLSFYHLGNRRNLAFKLDANRSVMYLTKTSASSMVQNQFLTNLKKHFEGAIITKIEQLNTDRVIILTFKTTDFLEGRVEKSLIFEAMGRHSNLFIVQNGVILDVYKKMFFADGRQLLPQAKFEYFPSDKRAFWQVDYQNVASAKDLVNQYLGISPLLANYLFETKISLTAIQVNPTKCVDRNQYYVFDLFADCQDKKHMQTLSELLDDDVSMKNESIVYRRFIDKSILKYQKKLANLDDIKKQHQENLKMKHFGDAIYHSGLDLKQRYSSLDLKQRYSSLDSSGETVVLDATKTLNENAQIFYKSYQKAKRGLLHLEQQESETLDLLELFRQSESFLTYSDDKDLKDLEEELVLYGFKRKQKVIKKKKQNPNIKKIIIGEVTYFIGKNHIQNAYLTHEVAHKEDYWFHVKSAAGSHVVVRSVILNEEIIRTAAMLAAYYSKYRLSGSIPVDYTQIKYLKKIPGKPGYQVSYRNEKTIYIDIDLEKIEKLTQS